MNRPAKDSRRWCAEEGCDTRLIFARRAGTDQSLPLEADDQEPFSQQAIGCLVVIANEAWRPADLIEDFRVRRSISETQARELVSGYPFHRVHIHEPAREHATASTGDPR